MSNEIVIGVAMLLLGAGFTQLMRASGTEARDAAQTQRLGELSARIEHIERSLADGGPQPLAQRVQRVEQMLGDVSNKIDLMYRTIVLRQEIN